MAKKNTTKMKSVSYSTGDELGKLIKLVIIVTIIVLLFYGITYFVNKEKDTTDTPVKTEIQYDNILIGNILTQPNDEYYVMIYDDNDYNSKVYEMYLSMYEDKEDAIRYYTADLTNPLNSSFLIMFSSSLLELKSIVVWTIVSSSLLFVSAESNFEIEDISDLKVSTSVLLKIKDKKIESVYVGDKLKQHLEDISKTEEE